MCVIFQVELVTDIRKVSPFGSGSSPTNQTGTRIPKPEYNWLPNHDGTPGAR
jgi:hypothetical protein